MSCESRFLIALTKHSFCLYCRVVSAAVDKVHIFVDITTQDPGALQTPALIALTGAFVFSTLPTAAIS